MCDVVYDSVGKDTFPASLDCLRPLGLFVSFGQSSGPIPPFNMAILSQKGSLFATRPTLFTYIAKRADLEALAAALFDVVGKGIVKVEINQRYALADAARAHADIEGRRTTGRDGAHSLGSRLACSLGILVVPEADRVFCHCVFLEI